MGENCIPSYVVIQHCGHLGIFAAIWDNSYLYRDYRMYKVVGFTFLFSPVIREDSHFGRICFKWVETTTGVQNTFEDDAKENIILKPLTEP